MTFSAGGWTRVSSVLMADQRLRELGTPATRRQHLFMVGFLHPVGDETFGVLFLVGFVGLGRACAVVTNRFARVARDRTRRLDIVARRRRKQIAAQLKAGASAVLVRNGGAAVNARDFVRPAFHIAFRFDAGATIVVEDFFA